MKTASLESADRAPSSTASAQSNLERRREKRAPAEGEVLIQLIESTQVVISAHLEDVSVGGFRASHDSPLLASGQRVTFNHRSASGNARVVWNRSADGKRESGFFIVEPPALTERG